MGDTFVLDCRSEFCEHALAKSKSLIAKMELHRLSISTAKLEQAKTFARQQPFFTRQWRAGDRIFPAC